MANFDGLWELRLIYSTIPTAFTPMEHRMTIDVNVTNEPNVGDDFGDFQLTDRSGSLLNLSTFCDDLGDLIEPLYPVTATFSRWEIWNIPEGTTDATFYSSLEIGHVGSNVVTSQVAWQNTYSFRSLLGGYAKLQLMEASIGGNGKFSPPYTAIAASIQSLGAFMVAATSPVKARDNAFIFSGLHFSSGQNEKLWRKRYRSS